jgi:hypothetical protein
MEIQERQNFQNKNFLFLKVYLKTVNFPIRDAKKHSVDFTLARAER